MMNLEYFRDVHPNWDLIANLDEEKATAVLDLLLLTVYIDEKLTAEEVKLLTEEWEYLPFVKIGDHEANLKRRLMETHSFIKRITDSPKLFEDFLEDITETFDDQDLEIAVFRLVAIVASADGFDERELELCDALGASFGLKVDTINDILRSVWESHEKAVDTEAGAEHHIPPIFGSNRARNRSLRPHPNPFSTRIPS